MTHQLVENFSAFYGTIDMGQYKAPMGRMMNNSPRNSSCLIPIATLSHNSGVKDKGKVIPLQARCGPEGG